MRHSLADAGVANKAPVGEEKRASTAGLRLLLVCLGLLLAASLAARSQTPKPEAAPSVVVQIKFEPGRRADWMRAFETHIAPAIREAIERKDWITEFAYFENVVVGQPYDFMLILTSDSFTFFDERRPYPHYRALFERMGVEEGRKVIAEMASWEASVSVTLMRSYGRKK